MAQSEMADTAVMKERAASHAASLVEDGMVVGLGSGSTSTLMVHALARRAGGGLHFTGVPTSEAIAELAIALGLQVTSLEDHPSLDLAIDGADEVDPLLNLIKGLGGALLREKIVASAARQFVIMVDQTKLVSRLGDHSPVPVEVVPFGWARTCDALAALGARVVQRMANGSPFISDGGHYMFDCWFESTAAVAELGGTIKAITGVVDHGLFIGMTSIVVVGQPDGVRVLNR